MGVTAMLGIAAVAYGAFPTGYYDSLEGKCGAGLKAAVKAVALKGHTTISYGTDTWNVFKETDVRTVNGKDYWWDMYSDNLVAVSGGHDGLNIEHSVANSWWGKTKNDAYKDLMHLNPSDADANNRKANYPLAELESVTWQNGVTFVGKPKSGQGGGSSHGYEPADMYKGDFARAFMYMFTVYDDISWKDNTSWMYNAGTDLMFKSWASELLVKWSANDPVDDKETKRNDGIYRHQKNRNPFIDLPRLADHIWGAKKSIPFTLEGSGDPVDDTIVYNWLAADATTLSEGWTFENAELPSGLDYVWRWTSYDGNHYLNGSAYKSGTAYAATAYAWSPVVDLKDMSSAKFTFDHAAKFQTTLRDLCRVAVRDKSTDEITEFTPTNWPASGGWNFSDAGEFDLSQFAGKRIQVGFKYASSTEGADTWEIQNASLTCKRKSVAVEDIPIHDDTSDDSFLVEVWGNNILVPAGARIFTTQGVEVGGENLPRGIYIVVKPSFTKSVKILIP